MKKLWSRMQPYLTWSNLVKVLGTLVSVVTGYLLYQKVQESRSRKSVSDAADTKTISAIKDTREVERAQAQAEANADTVVTTVTEVIATTDPGTEERLSGLVDPLAEMSDRRRREMLK